MLAILADRGACHQFSEEHETDGGLLSDIVAPRVVPACILLVMSLACGVSPTIAPADTDCVRAAGESSSYGCIVVPGILLRPDSQPIAGAAIELTVPIRPLPSTSTVATYAFTDARGRFELKWNFLLAGWARGDTVPLRLLASPSDSLRIRVPFTVAGSKPPRDTVVFFATSVP